jgi:membrane-associated protein
MELLRQFIDLFLHLDVHLARVVLEYGIWTYAILFIIIFCETGLVVTPILPGDSLLFTAGALAAIGNLNMPLMFGLLIVAAVLGDMVNYWTGRVFGARIFKPDARFLKTSHLEKTNAFYAKYGPKTIVIARFVPIVRTFAPFVAGMGRMQYRVFFTYNVVGAVMWVISCTLAGYLFGNIPWVKKNFTAVIFAIIFISILPALIGYLRARGQKKAAAATGGA